MIADISGRVALVNDVERERWFGISTKAGSEQLTLAALKRNGYECFLPLRRSGAASPDDSALFPGCLFCRLSPSRLLAVLKVPGVVKVLGGGGKRHPIDESTITALQTLVDGEASVDAWPLELVSGPNVLIAEGWASGAEAVVAQRDGRNWLVMPLPPLGQAIAVKINQECVQPAA